MSSNSHTLTAVISSDSIKEITISFHGSSLELQQLELVLRGLLPVETVYEASTLQALTLLCQAILEPTLSFSLESLSNVQ